MILTLDELKKRVAPVAKKYRLRAVYVFGSYARNEATEESDVDILVDRKDSTIRGMFDMGGCITIYAVAWEKPLIWLLFRLWSSKALVKECRFS